MLNIKSGLLCGLLLIPAFSHGQNYPVKPVRILSSGGAGGPNDTQTRGLAQYLGERLGHNFNVENRTGAGGVIAGEAGAVAVPPSMSARTGRTHQLRVHCAAIGCPILGDGKYGGEEALLAAVAGREDHRVRCDLAPVVEPHDVAVAVADRA